MTDKQSAGLLVYRKIKNIIEVLLAHPGGPYWKNKDEGAWSIPKGELEFDEDPLQAAIREFREETGKGISGDFLELQPVKLHSGKKIFAWAIEKNIDTSKMRSNNFEIEWPPHSGKMQSFQEVDKACWFRLEEAKKKINKGQLPLLIELEERLPG